MVKTERITCTPLAAQGLVYFVAWYTSKNGISVLQGKNQQRIYICITSHVCDIVFPLAKYAHREVSNAETGKSLETHQIYPSS